MTHRSTSHTPRDRAKTHTETCPLEPPSTSLFPDESMTPGLGRRRRRRRARGPSAGITLRSSSNDVLSDRETGSIRSSGHSSRARVRLGRGRARRRRRRGVDSIDRSIGVFLSPSIDRIDPRVRSDRSPRSFRSIDRCLSSRSPSIDRSMTSRARVRIDARRRSIDRCVSSITRSIDRW